MVLNKAGLTAMARVRSWLYMVRGRVWYYGQG